MFFSLSQMPQKMPWFAKDTMRTTLCTLVFLFSLQRSLNGHLTTSHKNTEVPNTADLKQKDSSIDSGRDNVVLFSRIIQKLHLTSLSEQRGIRPKTPYGDEISNQRTSRNIQNDKHNLTTSLSQPKRQTTQEVVATSQKEHQNLMIIALQKEVAQKSSERLNISNTDVPPKEKPRMRPLDTLEATHVSVSRSIQTQHFTSQSEQGNIRLQMLKSEGKTSYHRTKRNTLNADQNLTTMLAKPKTKMIPEEATTLQNEQLRPTESPTTLHRTSLQIEDAKDFNFSTQPPRAMRVDVSPIETTSRGHSETQEATPETPTSAFTELYQVQTNETGMGGNNTNTYGDVHTNKPSMKTTDQPSPITHVHTSTIIATTNLNGDVGTIGVKTTEGEVTSPKLETPFTTKTTSTTKKTTPKRSYPPPTSKEKQQGNPGPAVAAVIVTTLVLMFIIIIVILVRKRKMQKKQLENPEWAGPSPFLDGDVQPNLPTMEESEAIDRQTFNQISLSRYLPNRLSKQLASGRNTSEEVLMGDILQGSTFGRQIPDEIQAPNGNSTAALDPIKTEENKIQEAQASVDSLDTKTPFPGNAQETGIDSDESKQTDDLTPSPFSGTDITIKPPPLVSIDLDSLSEEAVTLQTSDGGIVPPAPPLP